MKLEGGATMGDIYEKYRKLAVLITEYEDIVDIYKDDSNGEYFRLRNNCDYGPQSVDNIETDGIYEFENEVYTVNNSTYVVIKTYESGDKLTESKLGKISIVLSYAGFGLLESAFLSFSDFSNFYKLSSGEGYVRGTVDDFHYENKDKSFSIVPSNDETKKVFEKLYGEKISNGFSRKRN